MATDKRLSRKNLSQLKQGHQAPNYSRDDIHTGVVHFGVGNFHRSHQAVYFEELLQRGDLRWGITGVSLRSAGMRDILKEQDYLYTLISLDDKSTDSNIRIIGALQNILVAPQDSLAVVSALASETTQLATTTITEKAYFVLNGAVDFSHAVLAAELNSLQNPKSIYGFLAAGLIQRAESNRQPMTILCCDNMQGGGEILHHGVMTLLKKHNIQVHNWALENCRFASSMVDRVTPATDGDLIRRVEALTGLRDSSPVAAEPFSQWVIEDNFSGNRPPLDQVGAQFVNAVAPYENAKLRLLNAAHSLLAHAGALLDYSYIHEAMKNSNLYCYAKDTLHYEVLPGLEVPKGLDVRDYIEKIFQRFANSAVPYACLQVGSDTSQKIQQRFYPSINACIRHSIAAPRFALALASWVRFVGKAAREKTLKDPLQEELSQALNMKSEHDIDTALKLTNAAENIFFTNEKFMLQVKQFYQELDVIPLADLFAQINEMSIDLAKN